MPPLSLSFFHPREDIKKSEDLLGFSPYECTHKNEKRKKICGLLQSSFWISCLKRSCCLLSVASLLYCCLVSKLQSGQKLLLHDLTTCRLYVWVKSSEIVNLQFHTTARWSGGRGYICVEAADNTFRNRNINVSTELGKKTRNLLNVFLEFRFVWGLACMANLISDMLGSGWGVL